jgi:predicted nucleotide-binding protein
VAKLEDRIVKGREIRNQSVRTETELEAAEANRSRWSKYNTELLNRLFDSSSLAEEYDEVYPAFLSGAPRSIAQKMNDFREDMDESINRLQSILERLDLIPEAAAIATTELTTNKALAHGRDVFVVHGHDDAAKSLVARYLQKLGLNPVILHEQPNKGRTLMEKLEQYSATAFAVVLLTPDDEGRAHSTEPGKGSSELQPRARQNVIFELGYLSGKLGRGRVCALRKGSIENPSDYDGVVYIPMDEGGGWQLLLLRELSAVGMEVDPRRLL